MQIDSTLKAVLVPFLGVLGTLLVVAYILAPFMLYGIHNRLGRLIEIQEEVSRQLARLGRTPLVPRPQTDAAPATVSAWSSERR